MKQLRTLTVFMAVVALLFFLVNIWFDIPITEEIETIAELVAMVLVALGILVDTSQGTEIEPLTWTKIIEKSKSSIAVNAMYALLAYIVYLRLAPEQADILLKIVATILTSYFGYAVGNNPNNQLAYQ